MAQFLWNLHLSFLVFRPGSTPIYKMLVQVQIELQPISLFCESLPSQFLLEYFANGVAALPTAHLATDYRRFRPERMEIRKNRRSGQVSGVEIFRHSIKVKVY